MFLTVMTASLFIVITLSYNVTLSIMYKINDYRYKSDFTGIFTVKRIIEYVLFALIIAISLLLNGKYEYLPLIMVVFYIECLASFIYISINNLFIKQIILVKFDNNVLSKEQLEWDKFFCAVRYERGELIAKYRIKNDKVKL